MQAKQIRSKKLGLKNSGELFTSMAHVFVFINLIDLLKFNGCCYLYVSVLIMHEIINQFNYFMHNFEKWPNLAVLILQC